MSDIPMNNKFHTKAPPFAESQNIENVIILQRASEKAKIRITISLQEHDQQLAKTIAQ
jgi:hypothetical protein